MLLYNVIICLLAIIYKIIIFKIQANIPFIILYAM